MDVPHFPQLLALTGLALVSIWRFKSKKQGVKLTATIGWSERAVVCVSLSCDSIDLFEIEILSAFTIPLLSSTSSAGQRLSLGECPAPHFFCLYALGSSQLNPRL